MKMNVLGINGSPRIGGNTDILLDKILEGAKSSDAEAQKVILNTLKFSACQECEDMRADGTCRIEDDFQSIYKKIKDADVIILASPVFFGSLSSQTKMMIDRFQCTWRAKYILDRDVFSRKKRGVFVSVEASDRKDFFDNARSIARNFFAAINAKYTGELLCPGLDEKGAVLKHPDILKKAFELGEKIGGMA